MYIAECERTFKVCTLAKIGRLFLAEYGTTPVEVLFEERFFLFFWEKKRLNLAYAV